MGQFTETGEEVGNAIGELMNWDYKVSADSVAMSVAHFYALNLAAAGSKYNTLSRMERLTYMSEQEDPAVRLQVLSDTLDQMGADFGTWKTSWGEINRFQRLSGEIGAGFDDAQPSIPVGLASGRWGALAAYGARAGENTKKIYGYRGNSFVAVVEFGDRLKAKTLLLSLIHISEPTRPY